MVGGVKYEHGHRMIAQLVGLLTIVLAIWIWRAEKRAWMRKLGIVALVGVVVQGILGGITVLTYLPWYISTAHAIVAQSFFALLVLMALFTSRDWTESDAQPLPDAGRPGLCTLSLLSLAALYLQLFFGGAFRHGGMSIAEHLMNAIIVTGLLIWTSVRGMTAREIPAVRTPARFVHALLWLQIALGFAAYLTRVRWGADAPQPLPSMVASTVAHLGAGALLLASTFILAFQARRYFPAQSVKLQRKTAPKQSEATA